MWWWWRRCWGPTPASEQMHLLVLQSDEPGTFSISRNDFSVTISIGTITEGITLTASDGTVLTNGLEPTNDQLSNISFSTIPNLNGAFLNNKRINEISVTQLLFSK